MVLPISFLRNNLFGMKQRWILLLVCVAASFQAAAVCNLPTNLAATNITGSSAFLTWTGTANFYNIRHRIKTPQGPWINSTSTPASKLIINLLPNTTYEYQIQGNCSGTPTTSGYTASAEFTTGNPCNAPINLQVYNIKSTSAFLEWQGPSNASFYLTRIRIASPQGPWINTTNTGMIKIYSTLLPSTTYEFQVATMCVNDPGQSVYSASIFFTTCSAVISDISLSSSNNALSVPGISCATEPLNHDSVQSIFVENCKNIAGIADTTPGNTLGSTTICSQVTTYVDSTFDINYRFGPRSYTVTPTNNGKATLLLFFTQHDFDVYNNASSTDDFRSLPSSENAADTAIPNFRIAHVNNGAITLYSPQLKWDTTYHGWYTILPMNSVKGTYYFCTIGACTGMVNFNLAVTNTTGFTTTATWTPVTTIPTGWYRFRIREINSGTWTLLGTSNYNTSSKLIQNLSPLTTYEIQIRKYCNSALASPWSPGVIFTTINTCYSPTGASATNITGTSAKISWTSVPGAAYYVLRYKQTSASTWISGSVTPNTKTISGLTPSKNYEYQLATNCAGATVTGPFGASNYFTTNALRGEEDNQGNVDDAVTNELFYPNPTTGTLHVQLQTEQAQEYQLRMLDMTGRLVAQETLMATTGTNTFDITMSGLANGLYIAQLFSEEVLVHTGRIEKK